MCHHRVKALSALVLAALCASCGDFVLYDVFLEELSIDPSVTYVYSYETVDFSARGGAPAYRYALAVGSGTVDQVSGLYTAPSAAGSAVVEVVDSSGRRAAAEIAVLGPRPLLLSPAAATILVFGSLQLTASGGKPGYAFQVDSGGEDGRVDGSSGLFISEGVAGTWVVRATDDLGQSKTSTITVVEPEALLILPSAKTLKAGEVFQFGAAGGSPPYHYSMASGTGSITDGGLYSAAGAADPSVVVRVTDSLLATSTALVSVVLPGPLGLTATSTSVEEGKTATFSAYGGTPGYTYSMKVAGSGACFIAPLSGVYTAGHAVGSAVDTVEVRDAVFASCELQVTVLPAAPTSLYANGSEPGPQTIGLTWTDNSLSEDGFVIQRKLVSEDFADVYTTAAGVTSFVDSGLSPTGSYVYRVRAFKGALGSGYTNEAFAVPNAP